MFNDQKYWDSVTQSRNQQVTGEKTQGGLLVQSKYGPKPITEILVWERCAEINPHKPQKRRRSRETVNWFNCMSPKFLKVILELLVSGTIHHLHVLNTPIRTHLPSTQITLHSTATPFCLICKFYSRHPLYDRVRTDEMTPLGLTDGLKIACLSVLRIP